MDLKLPVWMFHGRVEEFPVRWFHGVVAVLPVIGDLVTRNHMFPTRQCFCGEQGSALPEDLVTAEMKCAFCLAVSL